MAGAIALGSGEVKNTGALQVGMILVGGQVIIQGFNVYPKRLISTQLPIKELSESFGNEMQPVVMEFEGRQYELTGSAEEQYNHGGGSCCKRYISQKPASIRMSHRRLGK